MVLKWKFFLKVTRWYQHKTRLVEKNENGWFYRDVYHTLYIDKIAIFLNTFFNLMHPGDKHPHPVFIRDGSREPIPGSFNFVVVQVLASQPGVFWPLETEQILLGPGPCCRVDIRSSWCSFWQKKSLNSWSVCIWAWFCEKKIYS